MKYHRKAPSMPTSNVVLTKYEGRLVERFISCARYRNASESRREGRLIESRDAEEKVRREALRRAARAGIADFEASRFRTFGSIETLGLHLSAVADDAIASPANGSRRGQRSIGLWEVIQFQTGTLN
jgi:antitoxin ParD1/3/4